MNICSRYGKRTTISGQKDTGRIRVKNLALVVYFCIIPLISTRHPPKSQEEWMNLLQQQQNLHEVEMGKWKEILTASISLVDQVRHLVTR